MTQEIPIPPEISELLTMYHDHPNGVHAVFSRDLGWYVTVGGIPLKSELRTTSQMASESSSHEVGGGYLPPGTDGGLPR